MFTKIFTFIASIKVIADTVKYILELIETYILKPFLGMVKEIRKTAIDKFYKDKRDKRSEELKKIQEESKRVPSPEGDERLRDSHRELNK